MSVIRTWKGAYKQKPIGRERKSGLLSTPEIQGGEGGTVESGKNCKFTTPLTILVSWLKRPCESSDGRGFGHESDLCPCPVSLSLPQPISLMMFVLRGKYWPNQLKTRMQWSVQIRNMWFMSTWSEFRPKLRPQWGNDSQWSQHLSNTSEQLAWNATNASYCPILENKLFRKEDALGILLTQQWHNQNQRALHTSTVAFHHLYNFPLHISSYHGGWCRLRG